MYLEDLTVQLNFTGKPEHVRCQTVFFYICIGSRGNINLDIFSMLVYLCD